MTIKRVLVRERVRRIPAQFSWLDQHLVRDRHISAVIRRRARCPVSGHRGRCAGAELLLGGFDRPALGVHPQTVAKWVKRARYEARASAPRASRLDPFKDQMVRLLESHPYSAQQIFQRLREAGFGGGLTIVKDYVRQGAPGAARGVPEACLRPRRVMGSFPLFA